MQLHRRSFISVLKEDILVEKKHVVVTNMVMLFHKSFNTRGEARLITNNFIGNTSKKEVFIALTEFSKKLLYIAKAAERFEK